MPPEAGDFATAAWSWVDHLRHGGTRPWLDWVAGPAPTEGVPRGDRLPGAAQLEVVRRMAGRPGSGIPRFPELADLVLGRGAPGRGPDDLPLVWPADRRTAPFGPPPVNPSGIPDAQLVRVLVGVIAEQLVRSAASPRPRGRRAARPGAIRPGAFPVTGSPAVAASLRAALAATRQPPADPPGAAVVVAEPIDRLLAETWAWRVRRGGVVTWPRFLRRWARKNTLPPPADPAALAARWAHQVGADQVHVVFTAEPEALTQVVAEALGVQPDPAARGPRRLPPGPAELVRRVNLVLRGRVPVDQHARVVRRLCQQLPVLAGGPGAAVGTGGADPGDRLAVPDQHTGWIQGMAERTRAALCSGGYVLHGDPDRLLDEPARGAGFHDSDVLILALDTCLALAEAPATPVVPSLAASVDMEGPR